MNDHYKVLYSPEAFKDIKNIYAYIAFELLVPDIAEKQVNRIREKIRSLDFMPTKFPLVDWEPWKSIQMHQVTVDHYSIFYIIDNSSMIVTVVRIFYAGRDIKTIAKSE